MASQSELEQQIAALELEIASLQTQLAAAQVSAGTSASGFPLPPSPEEIANLENAIELVQSQLNAARTDLDNVVTIDDGSDPYVNVDTGSTTIAPQDTVDDGSDPYVSGGVTTIPLPQPQETPPAIEGPAYDDEGNLMPGWSLDEENNPVWVGNNPDGTLFVEPATQASADESRAAATASGISQPLADTRAQASTQDQVNAYSQQDWRVRLQLASGANYLYKSKDVPGILFPLVATNGVLFPYTPSISVSYAATYDTTDLLHSNYKIYQYKSSSVDTISITCDFTAQDTFEANYLLAVIHFFRSVTKMFYGQDQNPTNGTPPPLCYLTGMGAYQFDKHPLAITSFNYTLPTDVDYIQAGSSATAAGVVTQQTNQTTSARQGSGISTGGNPPATQFKNTPTGSVEPTYVPTKIQLSISAVPIVSRNDISNNFSLREYGTGALLRGSKNRGGTGIW